MQGCTRIHVYAVKANDRPNIKLIWTEPGTTQTRSRSARTADPIEAEKVRADLEYELNHGLHASNERIGWSVFSVRYADEKLADRRRNTREKWQTVSGSFHRLMKPASLADVGASMLSRYAARLRKDGKAKHTVAGHLAYLRAALRWAVRQGLLKAAPSIEMPKLPTKTHIRRTDQAGFLRILNAAPEPWRIVVALAWYAGLRRNEILALEWDDRARALWVDLERRRLWISAEWCKGDADSWLPIHPDLLAMLERLSKPSGKVFTASRSENEVSRKVGEFAARAGVPIKLHDLRRSFGSRYASKVEAPVLQRLMRHADVRTTLKYYVDVGDVLDEAIRKA